MTLSRQKPLLIGEVYVDVTLSSPDNGRKLRLGGITHSARGMWAVKIKFDVAVFLPKYLEKAARNFFYAHGCENFYVLGYIDGSPNIMLIGDVTEQHHQGYEEILRDEKRVFPVCENPISRFGAYSDALIIPGTYDLKSVVGLLRAGTEIHIDIAYDISSLSELEFLRSKTKTIFTSTSSDLFGNGSVQSFGDLIGYLGALDPNYIILKENRGGSRINDRQTGKCQYIPAQLVETRNSVGVGDVFDSVFVAYENEEGPNATYRASFVSAAYAETTFPDVFGEEARKISLLSAQELKDLGGTSLPWEDRLLFPIYLAAPDFSDVSNEQISVAIRSMEYHNLNVRRPIKENGELLPSSDQTQMQEAFSADISLLDACALVCAIPIGRDPGTLVEVGYAQAKGIPVVVFDPRQENYNTMVICGADTYSIKWGDCLNSIFESLSLLRSRNHD